MRHIKKLLVCSLTAYLSVAASAVSAATVTSRADIDWSTFSVSAIDIGFGKPLLTWTSQSDRAQVGGDPFFSSFLDGTDSATDWTTGTLYSRTDQTNRFEKSQLAKTSPTDITSRSTVKVGDDVPNGTFVNVTARSQSERSGAFQVSGTGVILFKANFSVSTDGIDPSPLAPSAISGSLSATVDLCKGISGCDVGFGSTNRASDGINAQFQGSLGSFFPPPLPDQTGVLLAALIFKDGETGFVNFKTATQLDISGTFGPLTAAAPVPVPASLWLFGSGLLALARRFSDGDSHAERGVPA